MHILFLYPLYRKDIGVDDKQQSEIKKFFNIDNFEIFYYDNTNLVEFKKFILEKNFEIFILCFPEARFGLREVQTIKSLLPKAKIVMYCPELKFVEDFYGLTTDLSDEIYNLYKIKKDIILNICCQSEIIIVETEYQKELLNKELNGVKIITKSSQEMVDINNILNTVKTQKKVSIIMLTFNQLADTKQALESLFKTTQYPYELIFIDNGSKDGTIKYLEKLKEDRSDIKIIQNDINLGFAKANNQGIKVATGEYILLLNNDVILTNFWLERMINCLESDMGIGLVGPCTNHAVGQQVVNYELKKNFSDINKFAEILAIKNVGKWVETHRIIGFCMLMKRELIEKVGLLDEQFGPGGYEDYDYCLRVLLAGYKIVIASDVFIYHIGGRGYSKNNLDYNSLRIQNFKLFVDKWCNKSLQILEFMPDGGI